MIKKLAGCVREYKLWAIVTPILMCGEVLMEVLVPLLMADLIDEGIDASNMSVILRDGLLLAAACIVSLAFGTAAGKTASVASAGFAKNLRHDQFYALQNYSFSNIDKYSTSSLVTRLTTDVNNVQMAFQMLIRMCARSPLMLVFSLFMAFRIHAELSLIFLAAIPVLGVGLYLIVSKAHPLFRRVFKLYDKLNRVVQENLHGIRVVKSFVREEHEKEKFGEASKEIYTVFTKAEKIIAFNMPLMQFSMYACMLLVSWFGARIIVLSGATEMETGELLGLITYSMQILSSLMMFSMVFVMFTLSRASAERITELLDEKSTITSPENALTEVPDGSISFDNVSFSYSADEEHLALKNICLEIKSGETIGILGGTGSSKSTLVQLIPRLYDTTSGSVKVGGNDVRSYDLTTLRDSVAMVLQRNVLFSGTISENLRWGAPDATDEELRRVCRIAQADGFITSFPDGYDTYIEQGGTNVSGGQKQRLCIARALLKKPKVLIFDDSTSAVDTKTDALIRHALANEMPGTTKLIIAQRVASVMDADKIIMLDNGSVIAMGTHDELMANCDIYREIFNSQQKGAEQE